MMSLTGSLESPLNATVVASVRAKHGKKVQTISDRSFDHPFVSLYIHYGISALYCNTLLH